MISSTSSLKKHAAGVVTSYHAVDSERSSIASDSIHSRERSNGNYAHGSSVASLSRCLASEVDDSRVTPPLVAYAFITGYIDAISFSGLFVWCGFQTGNFAQVALAFARLLESCFMTTGPQIGIFGRIATLPKSDQQSICSLLAFVIGTFIFGRLGDRVGNHKRGWLFAGTLIQAVLTLASAMTFWHLEAEPQPTPVASVASSGISAVITMEYFFGIACLSASLGVQGIMARRLNTQFSTTIVLTAVFVDLLTEPTLFQMTRPVQSRDEKWLAVISLFFGAVVGRLILDQLGTASTLGVAVILRILIAFSWILIPGRHAHLP